MLLFKRKLALSDSLRPLFAWKPIPSTNFPVPQSHDHDRSSRHMRHNIDTIKGFGQRAKQLIYGLGQFRAFPLIRQTTTWCMTTNLFHAHDHKRFEKALYKLSHYIRRFEGTWSLCYSLRTLLWSSNGLHLAIIALALFYNARLLLPTPISPPNHINLSLSILFTTHRIQ